MAGTGSCGCVTDSGEAPDEPPCVAHPPARNPGAPAPRAIVVRGLRDPHPLPDTHRTVGAFGLFVLRRLPHHHKGDHMTTDLITTTARALGWSGTILPATGLFGRHVAVAAELLPTIHQTRLKSGWGPVTCPWTVETWTWPEHQHRAPRSAVRLLGIIVPASHLPTGLAAASMFTAMAPVVIALPAANAFDPSNRVRADRYGIGIAASWWPGCVDILTPPRSRTVPVDRFTRLVHELVYQQLLTGDEDRAAVLGEEPRPCTHTANTQE